MESLHYLLVLTYFVIENLNNEVGNMKKKVIYGLLLLVLCASSLFSATKAYSLNNEMKKKEEELIISKNNYPEVYDFIDAMTVESFKNKIEKQEDFYVYVGRPTCGDCNAFEPELIELIEKYEIENQLKYLNVAKLRTQENEWETFKKNYDLLYTPTLAKFEQGKLVSKVEWSPESGISIKQVKKWIENNMEKVTN